MHSRILITALAALSLSASSLAQAPALSGVVTDGDREVLQSVTVTATGANGHSRRVVTGDDGAFHFADLQVGTYALSAELPGFRTVTVSAVVLSDSRPASIPISMTTEPFSVSLMVTGSSVKSQAKAVRRAPERIATRASR